LRCSGRREDAGLQIMLLGTRAFLCLTLATFVISHFGNLYAPLWVFPAIARRMCRGSMGCHEDLLSFQLPRSSLVRFRQFSYCGEFAGHLLLILFLMRCNTAFDERAST